MKRIFSTIVSILGFCVFGDIQPELVSHNRLPGGTLIIANQLEYISQETSPTRQNTWNRPDDWNIKYIQQTEPTEDSSFISVTTNNNTGIIISNEVTSLKYGLQGTIQIEKLDEISINPAPAIKTLTGPANLTFNGNRVSSSIPVTFRIQVSTEDNQTKYGFVGFTQHVEKDINIFEYKYDDITNPNTKRKSVTDSFYSMLNAGITAGPTGTGHNDQCGDFKIYNFGWCPARPYSGSTIIGFRNRNAVSPHVVCNAAHYGFYYNHSFLYFKDPTTGNIVGPVKSDMWQRDGVPEWGAVRISDWALTNGWTAAEINSLNISDIAVMPNVVWIGDEYDSSTPGVTVPEACCPYFITPRAFRKFFGDSGYIPGWSCHQNYPNNTITPVNISVASMGASWIQASNYANWKSTTTSAATINTRKDVANIMQANPMIPTVYSGDSGTGIFIFYDNKWILISHYHSVSSGPSYVNATPMLQAYAAQHGDTLKVIDIQED